MFYCRYSAQRNQYLFVVPPINLIVLLAWWVQDRWARAANADSWIELEVMERMRNRYRR